MTAATAAPGQTANKPGRPVRQSAQAIVRIVPHGGARTAKQIRDQWKYLSRKGQVQLQRSERHFGIVLPVEQIADTATGWVDQTGGQGAGVESAEAQELTTHIVVSFPAGTDLEKAFAAGRAWAEKMFGSGESGGTFDYLTASHSDRPHPHVHVVVNRRALEGHWLKISRRHAHLNYENMRAAMVGVARRYGIEMEASSRLERGIAEQPVTYAEYRRRARKMAADAGTGRGNRRPPSAQTPKRRNRKAPEEGVDDG